jgi:ParB-like chromosome segregation protein Spo0J
MSADLKFHPLADIFPLMEGAEFDELVADIKAHGLREPIVLYEGLILDGRNRYRACIKAGVEPSFVPSAWRLPNDDPAGYVISANIRRRHLTPGDKIKYLAQLVAARPEKSDRLLAKETGVSHPTIAKARRAAEATGKALPVDKRTGADGKARRRPATKRAKPKSEATSKIDKLFDELFFDTAPTKATSPPARARQDIGPASTDEVEQLRARVDELQAEKRQLEIRVVGLESENAELKAENVELRAKLEAAGASQQRPSTNGKGKEENGAGGNDALASAGKRKAAYALDAGSDPGPIPVCLRRDRVS